MQILSKEDITPELAETILDKIHLALTKENPDWQEIAMSDAVTDEDENSLNSSSRNALHKVLLSSDKELDKEAKLSLSKEFKKLKSNFLSQYLKAWANYEIDLPVEKAFLPYLECLDVQKSTFTAQIQTGPRKKIPNLSYRGLEILLQRKKGSPISGTDSKGKAWHKRTSCDFGILERSKPDGETDSIGVFVGPNPNSETVFVVNEVLSDTTFDVHKAILGFKDEKEARTAYLSSSDKTAKETGSILKLSFSQFVKWIEIGDFSKELQNPELEIRKSELQCLRSSVDLSDTFQSGQIYISKSALSAELVRKPIQVHTKHGTYISNRLVRNGELEPKSVPRSIEEPVSKRKRGRPSFPEGHRRVWSDGKEREKTQTGWKLTRASSQVGEVVQKTRKKRESVQSKPSKGETVPPTALSFSQIRTINQYTDKKDYDRKQIESLKVRIDQDGYDPAFPIVVDKKDGVWTVVAGHHRFEAVKELIEEGKLPSVFKIPVVTKEFASENKRLAAQVAENHRRSVLPTDEAKAYGKMQENGWDAKTISQELGISVGEVNKRLALNNLTPDLFALVQKKDRSLPLGVAETIGMFATDANGKPNSTIQIKAFKWFVENRNKYPGKGPAVVQEYIKELQSGELENFDFDNVATDIQREALRSIESMDKAKANQKMLNVMLDSLSKSYQRILGDNINSLSQSTMKELAASLALTAEKGVNSSSVLGRLDVIIQDLSIIKDSIQSKMREIEANASIPTLFARSFLADIEFTIQLAEEIRVGEKIQILKARLQSIAA
ncbi:ParB N-terminal domain-containing protein [Leptospira licerasiae]|uniref:ParB-like protein n=1 Tax=Leptospira licerasiae str. MMD4847 TaxID=1049971 RepID=A0ABP2RCQ2_9LEPT|nr:ParB N-terminal domain-containing protein [Leptospira licerasiae]EIE01438.1 ParB-like protein [Leptospira licerasiae serovar Varillal str. VAR 010]EJZ42331.1 ParB-like protein [Leptospira licerasiae str. MMD4847]